MRACVRLLDEGVDVWRPIDVEPASEGLFRIAGEEPEGESWEFRPGTLVSLIEKTLSDGPALVAAPARSTTP